MMMMMMMMMGVTKYYSSCSKCSSALDWVGGLQAICINSLLRLQKYGYLCLTTLVRPITLLWRVLTE